MINNQSIRLQKYFSDCHIMSRRAAETEIEKGNVKINGKVASLGDKIIPGVDVVVWNENHIVPNSCEYTYIMLNKPAGYVTTLSDEQQRKCVSDLIKDVKVRLYPVGRLDMYSEGLLLLTDDGDLTYKLTHPSHHISKKYVLRVMGNITAEKLSKLQSVKFLDGYELKKYSVSLLTDNNTDKQGRIYSELLFELYEGRNREIRKICKECNVRIISLKRTQIGNLSLGNLKTGAYRVLTKVEINYLKGI